LGVLGADASFERATGHPGKMDVRGDRVVSTSLVSGTEPVPSARGVTMKYMILMYGSQRDYDAMAGKATDGPALSPEDGGVPGAV
jgi:hypothetical protein